MSPKREQIPIYAADGTSLGFRSLEAAKRLIESGYVKPAYGRKGHLKAIWLLQEDGGNPVETNARSGTRYSFLQNIETGRCWSLRRLDRRDDDGMPVISRAVVRFYNKRGTAEQWIKEGKQAVKMTRLSCHRFRSNEVRLWLSVLAYNPGNLWRRLVLPKRIDNWSLTSLQQRLVKTGGRLIKHARYYCLMLAESYLTRRLFGNMVRRIGGLTVASA